MEFWVPGAQSTAEARDGVHSTSAGFCHSTRLTPPFSPIAGMPNGVLLESPLSLQHARSKFLQSSYEGSFGNVQLSTTLPSGFHTGSFLH